MTSKASTAGTGRVLERRRAVALAHHYGELEGLTDHDPLRRIAQLTARLAAAFVLDPAAVTRTEALGSERKHRAHDLPLSRDAFIVEEGSETTVDLDGHRAASDLAELALDDEADPEAA